MMRRIPRLSSLCLTSLAFALVGYTVAQAQEVPVMDGVPLQRGFYISQITDCADASNATLGLLHKDGFNAGRQAVCAFTSIVSTGENLFDYAEECHAAYGEDQVAIMETGSIEVIDAQMFSLHRADGVSEWRYCAQADLPEPWATNDIADLLE